MTSISALNKGTFVRRALLVVMTAIWVLLIPTSASAHPLGNFTTNRFTGLEITPGELRIHYVIDFAELAAFEEKAAMGDGDSPITTTERASYAELIGKRLLDGFTVYFDDAPLDPELVAANAIFRPGQGGLETLRVSVHYAADLPQEAGTVSYLDFNYSSRLGWKEVTATAHDGLTIVESSVPENSISDELRSYPRDLLEDPLQINTATVRFQPGEESLEQPTTSPREDDPRDDFLGESFTSLIEPDTSTPFLVAVALAMVLGAAHALGPGHGKLLLAAYLTGSEARPAHAFKVGIAVALMHTLSVVVVGLLILAGTKAFNPEDVYPWLGLFSGIAVCALGTLITVRRVRSRNRSTNAAIHHAHGHSHSLPGGSEKPSTLGLGTIAVGGGLLPSPSALVVLLGAVALHRTAAGVILVTAFGVGLAGMLIALGLLVLRTKHLISRGGERGASVLPILSSALIAGLGVLLTIRALTSF